MTAKKKTYEELRSARWFAPDDFRSFGHRSRAMQMGYDHVDWAGKPVIAIVNTWSDINNCHSHFKQRVEDVKRGILQAGGFPIELPAISLAENFVKPTTMMYRNLLAIETEELLRSHPVDGAVLMGGCDKTTPGLLMGALSMNMPCIYLPAGPMLRGNWKGKTLGSGSDAFKYWDERRAGNITQTQWLEVEGGIARSHGTCMVMGTAATMMGIAEAMGMTLPGASSIPAPDANHPRMSAACGRRIVDMVWEDQKPSDILTRQSFENAITVAMAEGCSTNAIIHLVAMSRRAGAHCAVTLDDFDAFSRKVPVIANIRPSGDQYLMEDFYYAGGMKGLMSRLRDGGLGDESSTNKFFADAQAGKLPAVTFYKPQGNLNMHAGYADVASGDRHIVRALKVLRESPQWKNMVVVVTVDENGGWWDHVAPPKGDRWGPGSRVPALVVSPFARKGTVDHTVYDTASILRLITRVFQLETLDGLKQRDEAMVARGQKPMGDLTNALHFPA